MNIHEVIENLGPMIFSNEETGVLITINGSYLNWFNTSGNELINADCRSFSDIDLSKITWIKATELAQEWYDEEFNSEDD